MPEAILSTRDLDAHYGDFQALFGVSMEVAQSEVVAIIGANGAGKTTLMRSISGLLANAPNAISFYGKDIGSDKPHAVAHSGIALVPEGRQLFGSLTVEENVIIGGQVKRPGPWSLKRIYELFPILGQRRQMRPNQLSGGQQQMVAIGRALMANPKLLMFDELSLGLAPVVIKDIYNALPSIVSDGMAAILVEQDISKALAASNRFYCLQEGRVSLSDQSDQASRAEISRAYFGADKGS